MLAVNIKNNIIALKDIKQEELINILDLYNMSDEFKYAVGTNSPVSLEMLEMKYTKLLNCYSEFFVGIHSLYEERIIGIITGKLIERALWINTIAVGLQFQGKGYGRLAIELLLDNFRKHCNTKDVCLAVADKNTKGLNFWLNSGFCELRQYNEKILFDGNKHNVLIMQKRI